MSTKKATLTIFFLAMVALSMAKSVRFRRQFPCNHPLRISAPQYFTHCDNCQYSAWSDWEEVQGNTQTVSESQCRSREAFTERRTRTSTQTNCDHLTETRLVCVPDAATKLILALGLGGEGQDMDPTNVAPQQPNIVLLSINFRTGDGGGGGILTPDRRRCPHTSLNGRVCPHLAGKRSIKYEEEELPQANTNAVINDNDLQYNNEDSVVQFSLEEHGHRFRRQTSPEKCNSDDIQHVLFVLDSSGSIGGPSYEKMKEALAKLTPLFCKKVKFALMTYSSYFNLEFCFDCFENTYEGRGQAAMAINSSRYQNGPRTKTGEAANCICNDLLSTSCGISSNPSCLDVVFITDGYSNGRRDICEEVQCLHRKTGINTYAIGINNYNRNELRCIADGSDRFSAFEFRSFDDFDQAITNAILRLFGSGNPLACAALYSNTPRRRIPLDPDSGLLG